MTTEATENPQPQQHPVVDAVGVYRILGGLERGQVELKEQLARQEERSEQRFARLEERADRQEERSEQRSDRQEERNEQRFREVNRRIDRLMYTIIGITTVAIAGYVLQQVFGA